MWCSIQRVKEFDLLHTFFYDYEADVLSDDAYGGGIVFFWKVKSYGANYITKPEFLCK